MKTKTSGQIDYENDIKRLVGRVIPYSQVKSEIKKELEPLL